MVADSVHPQEESNEAQDSRRVTIDALPNDALLNIFTLYQQGYCLDGLLMGKGKAIVDVCRRWRHIAFASPQHLDLQVVCNYKTPARTSLDIWPPCPIIVYHWGTDVENVEGEENIIAALERLDRVTKVSLYQLKHFASKKFFSAMTMPFPALKELCFSSFDHIGPILPATFLGEYAPRLELLSLSGVAFRALHKLLSSARHLSDLLLTDIPINCHIPPQVMVACLSASTHLEYVTIGFRPNRLHPGRKSRPPTSRAVLPALTHFDFEGDLKYMEDLVSRIAAPGLEKLEIKLFDDAVPEFPQLRELIALAKHFPPFGGYFVRAYPPSWVLYLCL